MSYKDFLGNVLPPDLVESDEEEDEMPDLVTTDTADIPWSHIKTGLDIIYGDHSPNVILTGKSKGVGVLVTHNEKYMYYVGGDNSNYKSQMEADTYYMTCSMKTKTGCNGRAIMKKIKVPGEDGEEETVKFELVSVATEEVCQTI